jgi:lipoprotein-releasing system ATP-binding protein
MSVVLEARGLRKSYLGGDGSTIDVLSGVDLRVSQGEFVAIMGASGAGKSTLLHLLGALDAPTAGEVLLDGASYADRSPEALAAIRNARIGFVFQFHHLLREFNARENVMMPLLIAGAGDAEAGARADVLLDAVGLSARRLHLPTQLSGGEQQRVAVARALANAPAVVLADEPSGNLDHAHSENLHRIFAGLARDFQTALVVVTHNRHLAERADRLLMMEAGVLVAAVPTEAPS